MKFDVVIGNPPYNDGLDIEFISLSHNLSTEYTCLITPAKWLTKSPDSKTITGQSYGLFRSKYLKYFRNVVFFPACSDIFDILQADGISYFLLDKSDNIKTCEITNKCTSLPKLESRTIRNLHEYPTLLNLGYEILEKLGTYEHFSFANLSSTGRYKVYTNDKLSGGGYCGIHDKNSKILVVQPSTIVDTKIQNQPFNMTTVSTSIFSSDSYDSCVNFIHWLHSDIIRFCIALNISSIGPIFYDDYFKFVPAPPDYNFNTHLTNEEIYTKLNLTADDIMRIRHLIKPRDTNRMIYISEIN